jgi:hypothetical protein
LLFRTLIVDTKEYHFQYGNSFSFRSDETSDRCGWASSEHLLVGDQQATVADQQATVGDQQWLGTKNHPQVVINNNNQFISKKMLSDAGFFCPLLVGDQQENSRRPTGE